MLAAGATVKVFDPEAMENISVIYGDRLLYAEDQYEALIGADLLAIVTEWSVFRTPSFKAVSSSNHI